MELGNNDRAREYADERARNLVRNYGKTQLRVLFLYVGGLFFVLLTVLQAAKHPTRLSSYVDLVLVGFCVAGILMLRMRIRRGWELLRQDGEFDPPEEDEEDEEDDSAEPQK